MSVSKTRTTSRFKASLLGLAPPTCAGLVFKPSMPPAQPVEVTNHTAADDVQATAHNGGQLPCCSKAKKKFQEKSHLPETYC